MNANPDQDQNPGQDQDQGDDSAALDGSAAAARRALADLAGLVEPGRQHGLEEPVLELEMGGIVTRAFVERFNGTDVLTVSARLPAGGGAACLAVPAPDGLDCLWHADLGCPMAVRRIPLAALPSERALLDALLAAADAAQQWHAALGGDSTR